MAFLHLTLLFATLQQTLALPSTELSIRQYPVEDCATGVHIITARGTGAPFGHENFARLSKQIMAKTPGFSTTAGLKYPAEAHDYDDYTKSVGFGALTMTRYIAQYTNKCPQSKIVLLGYSQGGQVVMDTICGSTVPGYAACAALGGQYTSSIAAAVAVADPSRVAGQPYNTGTGSNKGGGRFNGRNVTGCNDFYDKHQHRLRSWCAADDYYCDTGSSFAVHTSYFPRINQDILEFVVGKIQNMSMGS